MWCFRPEWGLSRVQWKEKGPPGQTTHLSMHTGISTWSCKLLCVSHDSHSRSHYQYQATDASCGGIVGEGMGRSDEEEEGRRGEGSLFIDCTDG